MLRTAVATLIGLSIVLTTFSTSAANDDVLTFTDDARCWRDATGSYQVDAALAKYHNRQVTLTVPERTAIELSIDQLSKSDQAYLISKLRAARKTTVKSLPSEERLVSLQTSQKPTLRQTTPIGNPQRLYNVDWHPVGDASRLAAAQNKPIMWFRVLGDLSGFM